MTLQVLSFMGVALTCVLAEGSAGAADQMKPQPIVLRYEAPEGCPGAEAFAAGVRAQLLGRSWNSTQPLQVHVVVASGESGYSATITSAREVGGGLERTVSAPTCADATDIAAVVITLAQNDAPTPDVVVATPAPISAPTESPAVPARASWARGIVSSFTLGYGAFTAGPADPVAIGSGERTTFNPAQGVRLGFGVTHALGWWKHSVHVSAAYYRQGTTTSNASVNPLSNGSGMLGANTNTSINDRDVLFATIDACPVQLDVAFLSFMPCATFTMMQTQGNSGNDPTLEVGFGGTGRVRGTYRHFFAEVLGTAAAVNSSYEPPSRQVRISYALSLGWRQ